MKWSDQASPNCAASSDLLALIIRFISRHDVQEEAGCDRVAGEEEFQKGEATEGTTPCDVAIGVPGMVDTSPRGPSQDHFGHSLMSR